MPEISRVKALNGIYVIHIHGDWCGTCQKIDNAIDRAEEYFKTRNDIEYLEFDQTISNTLADSLKLAQEKGLEQIYEDERHTGEVLYVDKESKKILTRFYGVNEKRIYIQAAKDILAGAEVANILSQRNSISLGKPEIEEAKKAKLFVVDIHHNQCAGCATVAPVFKKVAEKYKNKNYISFFTFDLSNHDSIDETRTFARELGIEEIYDSNKHTGEVLFIDAKNKELLDTLVLEEDPDVYHKLIKKLKKLV